MPGRVAWGGEQKAETLWEHKRARRIETAIWRETKKLSLARTQRRTTTIVIHFNNNANPVQYNTRPNNRASALCNLFRPYAKRHTPRRFNLDFRTQRDSSVTKTRVPGNVSFFFFFTIVFVLSSTEGRKKIFCLRVCLFVFYSKSHVLWNSYDSPMA